MDPIINDLLSKFGVESGKEVIQAVIQWWEKRKKRKTLTAADKTNIAHETNRMIRAATLEEVRRYDPAYDRLKNAVNRSAPKKKWAAKKARRLKRTTKMASCKGSPRTGRSHVV
jgi:hypothetical protein